ncbi:MAG TPA: pilus assembly protein PilM [Candidatus Paceibacterota bacterium]|nr:pilus assembly protein PilM [Candidatus Paceibacterota bacterium]HRZ54576.1 pilus assembly protein PilM [Candidatus Paceibacterota bacterium]
MALNLDHIWTGLAARLNRPTASRRSRRPSITALDLEGGFLEVVQAALRGGEPRVIRHAAVPLDRSPDADSETGSVSAPVFAAALARAGIRPGAVVMGVPRARVMLRTLDLPPAEREAEIAAMVHLRLQRDLPFGLDEALIDFRILQHPASLPTAPTGSDRPGPQGAAAPVRVLAAVVRRDTVEHYQSLAKAAGVKLAALGLRSLASARAAQFLDPGTTRGCVALVSVHRREVLFDVLFEGALVFSRVGALAAGAEPALEARDAVVEPTAESVLTEVVRSLHSYEGVADHHPIGRCLVTGSTGAEAALARALGRQLGVQAEVLDAAGPWSEASDNAQLPPHALPAVGLALGALEPEGLPIDLLNPKRPPVARDNRRVRQLGIVAAILAVLLAAVGLRARWIGARERHRAQLQEQITLGSKNLAAYRHVRNQARTLADWSGAGRNWLDHLTVLSALLPPSRDLYVTALSTSARNTLNLAVKIRGGETVDRLLETLRSAGYQVKAPAIMPAMDRFGFRFQANLELGIPTAITNDLDALAVESRPPPSPVAPVAPVAPEAASSAPPPQAESPAPPAAASPAPPPGAVPSAAPASAAWREQRGSQTGEPRMRRRRPEGGWRE